MTTKSDEHSKENSKVNESNNVEENASVDVNSLDNNAEANNAENNSLALTKEQKAQNRQAIKAEYKELAIQGLWKNNPGLVQLLGLCPLLAVTSTVINALGLGVATLLVLFFSNATISAIRFMCPKK